MDDIRKTAAEILSVFEEYLYGKGVEIENPEDEEGEYRGILCGSEYYEIEDRIAELIREVKA
ncbi:MAG: hypothetical protein JRH06_00630 [Deltaproteobacteria bacterium]|nr:hypothetical protein [Deltaproteobacteria bacterium]MBW2136046.1 hypothetical protein [Deltaproteobacteria bacterium]